MQPSSLKLPWSNLAAMVATLLKWSLVFGIDSLESFLVLITKWIGTLSHEVKLNMSFTLVIADAMLLNWKKKAVGNLESARGFISEHCLGERGLRANTCSRIILDSWKSVSSTLSTSMGISSNGYVDFLRRAEEIKASAMFLHHSSGRRFVSIASKQDDDVDEEICELFKIRSSSEFYGSVIFSITKKRANIFWTFKYWRKNISNR